MKRRTSLSLSLLCVALAFAGCGRPTASDDRSVEHVGLALTAPTTQINCGGPAFGSFAADANFSGGATLTRAVTIDMSRVPSTLPMNLYQTQRYNNMTYTLSGFAAGATNEVRLHFADTKWTTANQRTFNVLVNGVTILSNFDVIAFAGAPNKAVIKAFNAPASSTGAYVIKFVGTKDAAMISGIEVGPSVTPVATLPVLCSGHQLVVSDVQGDVRDIWSGRETAATGKRVGTRPVFKLHFNRAVEPTWLQRAVTLKGQAVRKTDGSLTDCRASAANGGLDTVPLSIADPAATWAAGTLGTSAQRYLFDLQVFVSGNVSGAPHVAGAVAAGGNVTVNGFALNSDNKLPYAVVTNGNLSLTSGTASGAASYAGTLATASASVTGASRHETLIDFAALSAQVLQASAAVALQTANGGLTFGSDKIARFVGVRADSNVFSIDASLLSQAKGITLSAPAASAVLVNVTGTNVSLANLAVTLTGVTANRVVWNAPDAMGVTLSSVTFLGALVAPKASVTLTGGSFTGQLVAASLAGTGVLKTSTFVGWESFGATNADVTISTTRPLLRACSYALEISGPLNSDLTCLGATFSIPFVIDPSDASIVSRDNGAVRWNAAHTQLLSFTPLPGVNTPASEVLSRYAAPLGIGPLETFAAASSWKTTQPSRTTALLQQQHLGVPVEGGSFLIDQETAANGQVVARWVRGAAVPVASNVVTPAITASVALSTALTAAGAKTPYPWTLSGTKFKAPTTTLMFAGSGATRTLTWRVELSASGVRSIGRVDVDALTGTVIDMTSKVKHAACLVTAPKVVADDKGTVSDSKLGPLSFDNLRLTNGASEARLLHPQGSVSGVAPATGYVPSMEAFTGPRITDPNDNLDITKLQPVCNQTDTWTAADVVEPSRALFFVEAAQKFVKAEQFAFNGGIWSGSSGNDATNGTQLRVISSLDPSWGDCPTPSSCVDSAKVPSQPFSTAVTTWRGDPYIYLNPAFNDPTGLIDYVQPVVVAHEFGHIILGSARAALNIPDPNEKTETGALSEGFCDLLGLSVARAVEGPKFAWSDLNDGLRDAVNPKSQSKPDTYGGMFFCGPGLQSTPCDPHVNATIFDHWFYLMTTGGSGTNDLQCSFQVTPPGATEDDRFKQALDIAFYAMTQGAGPTPDYAQIAEATNSQALALYGDALRQASAAAWFAVGVGKEAAADNVSPADSATGVNVWPASFSWTTTDTQPWEIQIASDSKFNAIALTSDASVLSTAGSTRTLGLTATLDSNIGTYYWRVRQKSTKPWGDCVAVFSFATNNATKVQLTQPETKTAAGVYLADPGADFTWPTLPNVREYFFTVKASVPATCPDLSDATGLRTGPATLDDTSVFFSARPFAGQFGVTYDNTSTFYATISAVSPDGKGVGPCLIAPFTISPLSPPTQLYPRNGDVVQLQTPTNFVAFTPVDGAVAYRVDIGRIKTPFALEDTFSQVKKISELEQKMNGTQPFIKFPVTAAAFAATMDDAYWTVWAIDANGYQIHNYGLQVFATTYHIGAATPKITNPMNGATGVNKASVNLTYFSQGAGPGTQYRVELYAWDHKLTATGPNNQTLVQQKVSGHVGGVGAVQSGTITGMADDASYQVRVTVLPAPALTPFADVSPNVTTISDFTTGAAPKTLAAPTLLWDVVCSPSIPGLGAILNDADATEFAIGNVAGADSVEMEFRDATDSANFVMGPVTATANVACSEVAVDSASFGMCGPSVLSRQCLVIDGDIHPVWSADEEAAADQRARTLWSGFSYQTFRFRYNNDGQKVKGAWSRPGIMVSCIDPSQCSWEKGTDLITPTNAPPFAALLGIDGKCDDSKAAQWLSSAISQDDCVEWH